MARNRTWWLLAAAVVILIPGRMIQASASSQLDHEWQLFLILLLTLAAAVLFLLCRLRRRPNEPYRAHPAPGAGIFSLLSGCSILAESVLLLAQIALGELDWNGGLIPVGNQVLFAALSGLSGIFGGITLMVWGGSLLRTGRLFLEHPIAALFPAVWGVLNLLCLFMSYTLRPGFGRNFLVLVPFSLAVLFLYAQAGYFSGVHGPLGRRKIFQYGMPFILFGLVSSVPDLLLLATGGEPQTGLPVSTLLVLLFLSLYALWMLLSMRREAAFLLRGRNGITLLYGVDFPPDLPREDKEDSGEEEEDNSESADEAEDADSDTADRDEEDPFPPESDET